MHFHKHSISKEVEASLDVQPVHPPPPDSATTPETVKAPLDSPQNLAQLYDVQKNHATSYYKTDYSIRDHATGQEAWHVTTDSKSVNLLRPSGEQVGSSTTHCYSSKNVVTLATGDHFQLTKGKGFFSESRNFSYAGRDYFWKRRGKLGCRFEVEDDAGTALARLYPTSLMGKYQFELATLELPEGLVDVILLTGLMKLEIDRRNGDQMYTA